MPSSVVYDKFLNGIFFFFFFQFCFVLVRHPSIERHQKNYFFCFDFLTKMSVYYDSVTGGMFNNIYFDNLKSELVRLVESLVFEKKNCD
jgi:hypothetical protein